jgi:hypothetical protein
MRILVVLHRSVVVSVLFGIRYSIVLMAALLAAGSLTSRGAVAGYDVSGKITRVLHRVVP